MKPSLQVGNYVFIDKTPLATISESSTVSFARNTFEKRQRPASGPHCILKVRANTATLDENVTQNMVGLDWVSRAPSLHNSIRHPEKRHKAKQRKTPKVTSGRPTSLPQTTDTNVYVVKKIIFTLAKAATLSTFYAGMDIDLRKILLNPWTTSCGPRVQQYLP